MAFQITSLPKQDFEHLFTLSPDELAERRAVRMTANKKPGFPCRVSLVDAEIGEEVLLVNYQHQNVDTPYRASHAVFVRLNAEPSKLSADEVPEQLRSRTLSLRAFDEKGMMVASDLAEGRDLEASIEEMFRDPRAAYLHLHFAKAGCYAARVDRSAR
jgi:hypothetical protein